MEGFLNTPGVSEDPEWGHSIHTASKSLGETAADTAETTL